MVSSSRPHQLWTRIDIEPDASLISYNEHERCVIINKDDEDVDTFYCLYGPCELELYNHFQLRQNVRLAKLNVWYPGSWQKHSNRVCFRTTLSLPTVGFPSVDDDDDDEKGSILLEFQSNARIVIAVIQFGEEESYPLRWKSTERTVSSTTNHGSEETTYYHVIHVPSSYKIDDNHTTCVFTLTLDSTHADELTPDETLMDLPPPPCIVLTSSSTFSPTRWEWNSPAATIDNDEWITITSHWRTNDTKSINLDTNDCTNTSSSSSSSSSWKFPHQLGLCQISAVLPTKRLYLRDGGGETIVTNAHPNDEYSRKGNEIVYDFDKEYFGRVHITMSKQHPRPSLLIIRVGETWAEAMNNGAKHFEQCVDISYSLQCDSHTWYSQHLVAFRYVRLIISTEDDIAVPWNDITIECEAHMPHLYPQRGGTFSCTSTTGTTDESSTSTRNLDTRIWHTAEYTLQLCTYQNFIIDGVKRDRLPWAGDLFIGLVANAYTSRNVESIRSTLIVLGRCGLDNLIANTRNNNIVDTTSNITDTHINGMVDYTLWFIISHWLYQKYFDDIHLLRQEWRVIQLRLTHLAQWCSDPESGRFIVTKNDRVFIDWSEDSHDVKSTTLQILWWYALDCGIALAKKINDGHEQNNTCDILSTLMEKRTKMEISYLQLKDIQENFSRHSHIIGIVSGLYKRLNTRASGDWWDHDTSDEKWYTIHKVRCLYDRSREALLGDTLPKVSTPFFRHLEVLAINALGERTLALTNLRRYWGGMLDANATTFFEAYTENETTMTDTAQFYNRPYGRSLCHAWAAGPCALYPEIVLGLCPLTDGWREWVCDPLLSCIQSISCRIETKYGFIHVHLDDVNFTVAVPQGTSMLLMDKVYTGGDHLFPRKSLISSHDTHEWSKKYRDWTYHPTHVIQSCPIIPGYDGIIMTDVHTVYQLPNNDLFYMSFVGFDGSGYQTFVAESTDLLEWTNMRLAMGYGDEGSFDYGGVVLGAYLYESYELESPRVLKNLNGKFYSLYGAYMKQGEYEPDPGFQGLASSIDGIVWQREQNESILSIYGPGTVQKWEKDSIYMPWLVEYNSVYYNFYNAKEMPQWIEQIGLATSTDLRSWVRHTDNPILKVSSHRRNNTIVNGGYDTQFKSDAKVFWDDSESHWVMFYFGVGNGGAHIMVAFSYDLIHWVCDPIPLYKAGANTSGLDKQHAHKISLVRNHKNGVWYMFYCAVGNAGRGIGLIMSQPTN